MKKKVLRIMTLLFLAIVFIVTKKEPVAAGNFSIPIGVDQNIKQHNLEEKIFPRENEMFSVRSITNPDEQKLLTVQFFSSQESTQPFNEQIVKNGDMLFDPGVPSDKSAFIGWFEENGNQAFQNFGIISGVDENKTLKLYAHYTDQLVHVFYHDQKGEVIQTDSFEANSTITVNAFQPSVQVDPNTQDHIGWTSTENSTENVSGDLKLGQEDIHLYPLVKEGYWITFNSQGGTTLDRQFIAQTEENKKIENKTTQKQGYVFKEWTTDQEGKIPWDFTQDVTKPLTLYAQWQPGQSYYTIKYWLENPNPDEKPALWLYRTREAQVGSQINFDTATHALTQADLHGAINGVTLNTDKTDQSLTVKADGSSVLNVYYTRNKYTMTFKYKDENGVDQVKRTQVSFYESTKKAWDLVGEYANYTNGWKWTSKELNLDIYNKDQYPLYNLTTDLTFERQNIAENNRFWTLYFEGLDGKISPSIKYYGGIDQGFEKNGKTYFAVSEGRGTNNKTIIISGLSGFTPYPDISDGNWVEQKPGSQYYPGYLVYFYANDPSLAGATVVPEGKEPFSGDRMNLYYSRMKYRMNFEENGGPISVNDIAAIPYEQFLSSYEPKQYIVGNTYKVNGVEQRFSGWYLDEKLTVGPVDWQNGRMPANHLNLYAKWDAKTHTVTFDTQGGNEIDPIKNIAYGARIEKPTDPIYKDHTFIGWTLDGKPYAFESGIHEDITLVAEWKPTKSYQITYDANGGEGTAPEDGEKYYDTANAVLLAPTDIKAPERKVFLGWKYNDKIYYPGMTIPVKGDIKLVAQWGDKAKSTKLTYDFNFNKYGIIEKDPQSITITDIVNNSKVTLKKFTDFRKIPKGWMFTGWYLDKNATTKPVTEIFIDNIKEETNIVYAGWIRIPRFKPSENQESNEDYFSTNKNYFTINANHSGRKTEIHKAYIKGYEDGSLRPERNISRAEAAAIVVRLKEIKAKDIKKPDYQDTEENTWYNPYINAAIHYDLLVADGDKIRPNDPITRAELARMLAPIDKKNNKISHFTDIQGHKYEKEINQAYGNQRAKGYPDNSFRPDAEITRSETATMLNRMFNRSADKNFIDNNKILLKNFADLKEQSWYYYEMEEAINSHEFIREENGKDENWIRIIN